MAWLAGWLGVAGWVTSMAGERNQLLHVCANEIRDVALLMDLLMTEYVYVCVCVCMCVCVCGCS